MSRPTTLATNRTNAADTSPRDWSLVEQRLDARPLRHGDRVVAVATVGARAITIHGFGVYQHDTTPPTDTAAVNRLAAAISATDTLQLDYTPLVAGACRHVSKAQADAQHARFHSIESRRRVQPADERALAMLDRVHHRRRVRLDSGAVIDADGCFVMRADAFHRYSGGTIVTKSNA